MFQTKTYNATICHFKLDNTQAKPKWKPATSLEEDDVRMSCWKLTKHMLQVKDDNLTRGELYNINVDYESDCIEDLE
jgi:hypothetical protein